MSSGEEEWKAKLKKPKDLVQKSLADRFNQLQDSGDAWKKKVSLGLRVTLYRVLELFVRNEAGFGLWRVGETLGLTRLRTGVL